MKILVLMKEVPDTWGERRIDQSTLRTDREGSERVLDEICERALEWALRIKDSDSTTEVIAVSMAPSAAGKSLKKSLAMGANKVLHVVDDALVGADILTTAETLAAAARAETFDLIVAGNESTDGRGGVVPSMIAEFLGVPHLSFMETADITNGQVTGIRNGNTGATNVSAPLPAVISITERMPDPRFPTFRGLLTAKKKPFTTVDLHHLGTAPATSTSTVESVALRPARTAGTTITDDGQAHTAILDFLVHHRLL